MTDLTLFRDNGYQIIRGLFSKDLILRGRAFFEKEHRISLDQIRQEIGFENDGELIVKISELLADEKRFSGISPEAKSILSGHLRLEARLSRELLFVPNSAEVRALLSQIFSGQRLRMHMPPTARFVIPHNVYAAVPPHCDVSYNEHMEDFVVLWVPFTKIDKECGGVIVYKGSGHERPLPRLREKGFWIEGVSASEYESVHCEMDIGDALLFNRWVIHQSAPNVSGRTRFNADYRFFGDNHGSKKHFLDVETGEVFVPRAN